MKKLLSLLLCAVMVFSICTATVISGCAQETYVAPVANGTVTAAIVEGLYAHAYSGTEADTEAWVRWYKNKSNNVMCFFMPTCTDSDVVEIYNNYLENAVVNGTTIAPSASAKVSYEEDKEFDVKIGSTSYKAVVMRSSAEGAMFINNPESFNGKDLWGYLTADKENDAKASGALLDDEGNIDNTGVKKIKGRGNTSWDADKKGFNVTYDDAVEIGTMQKCKKFSLISNFQDASLSRNRILYDLADEIGVPYASDSRFVEFYVNGEYIGNYQACEKVDVGKNTLMADIDDEEYLEYCAGTKDAFSFVCEIDSNPSDDDFTVKATNGNNLTIKAPELETSDSNYLTASRFIRKKYEVMYNKLIQNAADVDNFIDIESLAQVYLINELGKNWDAGAGSFFFVYKPDENGNYKFFASPVWDYDNSLGNAQGVEWDLRNMGIDDYEEPTGWFAKHKNGYRGPNVLKESIAKCDALNEMVPVVWFEQFVPAIDNVLNGENLNNTELYSKDVYLNYLTKSAKMNFIRWDIIQEPQWIADHTSLNKCYATYTYNDFGQITGVDYKQDTKATSYGAYVFEEEYRYMIDWTNSRVAWMSSQYIDSYEPETPGILGDADEDGEVTIMDATEVQLHIAKIRTLSDTAKVLANVDGDKEVTILDATGIQLIVARVQ